MALRALIGILAGFMVARYLAPGFLEQVLPQYYHECREPVCGLGWTIAFALLVGLIAALFAREEK